MLLSPAWHTGKAKPLGMASSTGNPILGPGHAPTDTDAAGKTDADESSMYCGNQPGWLLVFYLQYCR